MLAAAVAGTALYWTWPFPAGSSPSATEHSWALPAEVREPLRKYVRERGIATQAVWRVKVGERETMVRTPMPLKKEERRCSRHQSRFHCSPWRTVGSTCWNGWLFAEGTWLRKCPHRNRARGLEPVEMSLAGLGKRVRRTEQWESTVMDWPQLLDCLVWGSRGLWSEELKLRLEKREDKKRWF